MNEITNAWPIPSAETLETLRPHGHGVRYFFASEGDDADEMTYETLAYCVRNEPEYGFADGDTIAEASSHSDAELWSDVILPAIADGRIQVSVWGEPLQ